LIRKGLSGEDVLKVVGYKTLDMNMVRGRLYAIQGGLSVDEVFSLIPDDLSDHVGVWRGIAIKHGIQKDVVMSVLRDDCDSDVSRIRGKLLIDDGLRDPDEIDRIVQQKMEAETHPDNHPDNVMGMSGEQASKTPGTRI
jgi:hypothetical protein